MSLVSLLRNYFEFILVASGVGGVLKSAYNGTVRDKILRRLYLAEDAHEKTMEMEEKLDGIEDTLQCLQDSSERQIDYLVAMGRAVNEEDTEFDVEALREEHNRDGASEFTRGDD